MCCGAILHSLKAAKRGKWLKHTRRRRCYTSTTFFKPVKDYKGNRQFPGMAEVWLAFEIINYRYIKNLPTIISSEWRIRELDTIDEAIASRIYEKCVSYIITIQPGKEKNRRYGK